MVTRKAIDILAKNERKKNEIEIVHLSSNYSIFYDLLSISSFLLPCLSSVAGKEEALRLNKQSGFLFSLSIK